MTTKQLENIILLWPHCSKLPFLYKIRILVDFLLFRLLVWKFNSWQFGIFFNIKNLPILVQKFKYVYFDYLDKKWTLRKASSSKVNAVINADELFKFRSFFSIQRLCLTFFQKGLTVQYVRAWLAGLQNWTKLTWPDDFSVLVASGLHSTSLWMTCSPSVLQKWAFFSVDIRFTCSVLHFF